MFNSFSGFEAFAEPKDPKWGRAGSNCDTDNTGTQTECCWINEAHEVVCQLCNTEEVATGAYCGPVHTLRTLLPGDKVLEELTKSPLPSPPLGGGKRLFGSDVPTLSVSPDGGSTNDGGKVAEQPPTAPITPPTVSSPEETDQGDGDKKPPQVKDLPGIDITEQPEVQQQEQGEQPSNEGQGPAGPLT